MSAELIERYPASCAYFEALEMWRWLASLQPKLLRGMNVETSSVVPDFLAERHELHPREAALFSRWGHDEAMKELDNEGESHNG